MMITVKQYEMVSLLDTPKGIGPFVGDYGLQSDVNSTCSAPTGIERVYQENYCFKLTRSVV